MSIAPMAISYAYWFSLFLYVNNDTDNFLLDRGILMKTLSGLWLKTDHGHSHRSCYNYNNIWENCISWELPDYLKALYKFMPSQVPQKIGNQTFIFSIPLCGITQPLFSMILVWSKCLEVTSAFNCSLSQNKMKGRKEVVTSCGMKLHLASPRVWEI